MRVSFTPERINLTASLHRHNYLSFIFTSIADFTAVFSDVCCMPTSVIRLVPNFKPFQSQIRLNNVGHISQCLILRLTLIETVFLRKKMLNIGYFTCILRSNAFMADKGIVWVRIVRCQNMTAVFRRENNNNKRNRIKGQ